MARSRPATTTPKRAAAGPAKKVARKSAKKTATSGVRRPRAQEPTPLEAFDRALQKAGFGRQQMHLLLQARRIGKLLAIQQNVPKQEFPPGVCFLHVNLPSTDSICVRSLVEIDLDACTVLVAIHGDQELESGHVILPLEGIGWIGFPDKQVPVGIPFAGFHLPTATGKPLLVK